MNRSHLARHGQPLSVTPFRPLRKARVPSLSWLMLLTLVGCGEQVAAPVRIIDGDYAVEFEPATTTLRLLQKEVELLRFPADAWQVATVAQLDARASFDPYWLEYGDDVLSAGEPANLIWHHAESVALAAKSDTQIDLAITLSDGQLASVHIERSGPGRFVATLSPKVRSERPVAYLRLRPRVDTSEAFYGLGGFADEVNHRGKVRPMQQEVDVLESKSNELRVPIPLLIGTRGWGLFVESRRPGVFAVANKQPDLLETTFGTGEDSQNGLRFHLLAADEPIDITGRYYEITGQPQKPAKWALGPWIWRNENKDQAQVLDDVRKIRDLDLATSAIWIDRPYASFVNSFDFEKARFPDPQTMIAKIHAAGLRLSLWHAPYLEPGSPDLAEATRRGLFPKATGVLLNRWSEPIDFTNPEAVALWKDRVGRYIKLGIEGFKLDYGEDVMVGLGSARTGWRFSDGSRDATVLVEALVAGGVDHVLHAQDLLGDGGELVLGAGPDQPGLADRVRFGFVVRVVVGDAALVEVVEDFDFAVAAEELLVGAEGFGRGAEAVLDALAQADLLLDLLVGDQVKVDGVGLLADTVDAAGALDDPDDGPGQVVADDDVAVLQVLSLGEHVGCHEDVDRVVNGVHVVLGLAGQLVRHG